jgi:hypothetical protein
MFQIQGNISNRIILDFWGCYAEENNRDDVRLADKSWLKVLLVDLL